MIWIKLFFTGLISGYTVSRLHNPDFPWTRTDTAYAIVTWAMLIAMWWEPKL